MKGINMNKHTHTFVICAYKESEYLEDCIKSLVNQTVKSKIIIITSTPNEYIKNLSIKYNLELFINEGEGGITQDWNFGYSKAQTDYITIAHQDDLYDEKYLETFYKKLKGTKRPLIFFTDYYEIRNDEFIKVNKLLKIKRLMLFPLKFKIFWKSKFVRRRILSLGSPICCPAVTFVKDNIMNPVFLNHFRTDEDWEAWERISRLKGEFIYSDKALTFHRIHKDSETSAAIAEEGRSAEDYEMYLKFWPKFMAKFLTKMYSSSEKSNNM
jgi:glycosyltransferase involved in cell wall biosynthesis